MKKRYITPAVDITKEEIDDVLYTTSVSKGTGRPAAGAKTSFLVDVFDDSSLLECDMETEVSKGVDWGIDSDIFQ